MKNTINLLPASYRRQQMVRKRSVQWSSVVCLVIVSGWALHWSERREATDLSQQLESLEREHAPTQTMLKQLTKMRKQLDDLQQQESVARELEYHRNALALLGVISDTARATNGRVRVTKLELTNFQNMRAAATTDSQDTPTSGLMVTGVSLDNPAVAEFLDSLQDSGIFNHVELLGSKEREENGVALLDYELRCQF